ncbi:SDR family oxidoreductase [Pectinatus cerevisiiphilus]|uniref:Sorbitol-6-phosphate 2-dehydrogenase n=1 Tax=Pectinatus cerevisiiphilus TaxID=86956 RepID=A0A4R3K239_9FIRM|nr:SDR family oxidoreductase [Pectinatus cerevisiiphilus]TCS76165.1 sorbitol-6-phosphate 2-dehydrogenase [Pectinatus cerevisiiphilus]
MTSWLGLEGKTAVITGGASGIGKAIAQAYLDNGANAIVCDINNKKPDFMIKEYSGKLFYITMDITIREEIENMVKSAKERFGSIDILVNNAGINIPGLLVDYHAEKDKSVHEIDEKIFDKIVNINLKGLFFCSQIIGHEFVRNKKGIIINLSSESGLEGSEGQSVYAATKNAVNSLTRSWAKELGRIGVRVVAVAPGILEATGLRTPEYENALAYTRGITVTQLRNGYNQTSTTPLGRCGKLDEVADLVCYLSSKRAGYIHGVTYNIAGGKTRG